jgi:hypothetical protein
MVNIERTRAPEAVSRRASRSVGTRRAPGSRIRSSKTLPALAFAACAGLVLVPIIDPTNAFTMTAQADVVEEVTLEGQSLIASGEIDNDFSRDTTFTVTEKEIEKVAASAPSAGKPNPGSAKAIAQDMVKSRGWDNKQYSCLVALWNKESGWNVYAHNKGSGAYGIAQALPGAKMASAGSDWATSAKTQIKWGLGYISGRYGTPCAAWASSESRGWY